MLIGAECSQSWFIMSAMSFRTVLLHEKSNIESVWTSVITCSEFSWDFALCAIWELFALHWVFLLLRMWPIDQVRVHVIKMLVTKGTWWKNKPIDAFMCQFLCKVNLICSLKKLTNIFYYIRINVSMFLDKKIHLKCIEFWVSVLTHWLACCSVH